MAKELKFKPVYGIDERIEAYNSFVQNILHYTVKYIKCVTDGKNTNILYNLVADEPSSYSVEKRTYNDYPEKSLVGAANEAKKMKAAEEKKIKDAAKELKKNGMYVDPVTCRLVKKSK